MLCSNNSDKEVMNKMIKYIKQFIKKQSPGRLIAMGFASVILIGTILLLMPVSVKEGAEVSFIDALFTSTSAVCVTGLIVVCLLYTSDAADD